MASTRARNVNGDDTREDEPPPSAGRGGVEAQRLRAALKAKLFDEHVPPARVGRYLLGEPLGQGAMGTVYRAYDPELDRRVAIKVLRGGARADADRSERLRREARALAKLSHPNVLAIYEVGESGGSVFVALELIDGGDLAQWCADHPPVSRARAREVLAMAHQVAQALIAAHDVGIVHRDVKPSNILLGSDARTRLGDFGLARRGWAEPPTGDGEVAGAPGEIELTATGAVLGTPAFMAPEQFRGESDAKSDQFSWCATFFEALYGRRAFDGESISELVENVEAGRIVFPARDRGVPGWIRPVLLRGLSPDPGQRYPSMAALLRDLASRRGARRRWTWAASIATVGVGVAAWQLGGVPSPPPDCELLSPAPDELWDEPTRARVRAAVEGDGSAFEKDTWARVSPKLEAVADGWSRGHTDACRESRSAEADVRQLGQRRTRCLDRAASAYRFATETLAGIEPHELRKAIDVAHTLEDLADCTELEGRAGEDLDDDSAMSLSAIVAESRVLRQLGRWEEARDALRSVLERSEGTTLHRSRASAHIGLSMVHAIRGELEESNRQAEDAVDAATAAGDDGLLVQGWLARMSRDEPLELQALALRRAEAVVARADLPPELRAHVRWKRGQLAASSEDTSASEHYEAALTVLGEGGPSSMRAQIQLDFAEALLTTGSLDRAVREGEASLQTLHRYYGTHHPVTALGRARVAQVLLFAQRFEEAVTLLTSAVESLEAQTKYSPAQLAFVYGRRAMAHMQLGDYDAARADVADAVRVLREKYPDDHPQVLDQRRLLARVLFEAGRPGEAKAEAEAVLAAWDESTAVEPAMRADVSVTLAEAQAELGQCEAALATLTSADAVLAPTWTAGSAVHLQHEQTGGRILGRCRRFEDARRRLKAARQLAAQHDETGVWAMRLDFGLAQMERDAGDSKRARALAQAALGGAERAEDRAEIQSFIEALPQATDGGASAGPPP